MAPILDQVFELNAGALKENPILKGLEALQAAGIQLEFAAANLVQTRGMNTVLILRAGSPPVYNEERSAKSGLNLTKTSNHGLFKGSLALNRKFTRLEKSAEGNIPKGHYKGDSERLRKPITDPDYQHAMDLKVTMRDILREIDDETGDLKFIDYNPDTGRLTLAYKPGKGPQGFEGQFVIDLNKGTERVQTFSRPWDKPEFDKKLWDAEKKTLRKPNFLAAMHPDVYKALLNQEFVLNYSDTLDPQAALQTAKVLANTPRTPQDFLTALKAIKPNHPLLSRAASLSLEEILKELEPDVIRRVYDHAGKIITGDWDGLALCHAKELSSDFIEVYNTFERDVPRQMEQMTKLLEASNNYLGYLIYLAKKKNTGSLELSYFDKILLELAEKFKGSEGNIMDQIVSKFALQRAGCITPHEFVFEQLSNYAYRDSENKHFGEKVDMELLQNTMDWILKNTTETDTNDSLKASIEKQLKAGYGNKNLIPPQPIVDELTNHIFAYIQKMKNNPSLTKTLPHPHHDPNVHDLYQHGFDMRNPYGCNLEGAWFMVTPDGAYLYGQDQEQLIALLLTDDFLDQFRIDINHGADMSAGWDKVIERQLQLVPPQIIPKETLASYERYKRELAQDQARQELAAGRAAATTEVVPPITGPGGRPT